MSDNDMKRSQRGSEEKGFMCGVCEGFYGKPWTVAQRLELFRRMQRFGMNTYLYAPKDDYKHRLDWRELYTEEQSDELKQLISAADDCNVSFVYALSPGLDVVYTSSGDITALKAKLDQVSSLGCRYFALLFDDIDDDLCPEDLSRFSSPAEAQCSITNEIYGYLKQPDIFLFCPTEYCSSRTEPDLLRSSYLQTIGKQLNKNIDFLWTGQKVVSQQIAVEAMEEISRIVQRKVTIWDNLHANDYDQTRLYLGPYSGRDARIVEHTRGVLTNPNCEFEVNFVALHTLAQWSIDRNTRFSLTVNQTKPSSSAMDMDVDKESGADREEPMYEKTGDQAESDLLETESCRSPYNPRSALVMAILDWLPELYKIKTSCGMVRPNKVQFRDGNGAQTDAKLGDEHNIVETGKSVECDRSPMQSTESLIPSEGHVGKGRGTPDVCEPAMKADKHVADMAMLTVDDMVLICHLFYLPYEHGPRATAMLHSVAWLLEHLPPPVNVELHSPLSPSSSSDDEDDTRYEWYDRASRFSRSYRDVAMAVDKLVNIPNRELLYDVYAYITDMRSTLALVNSYIKWLGCDKPDKERFKSGDQEPWIYRGGLLAEFRSLLPVGRKLTSPVTSSHDVPQSVTSAKPSSSCIVVRPYCPADKDGAHKVCERMFTDSSSKLDIEPQLFADWHVGGLLEFTESQCCVVEDSDMAICGYVVTCIDVAQYYKWFDETWLPSLKDKCPKLSATDSDSEGITQSLRDSTEQAPAQLLSQYPSMLCLAVLPSPNGSAPIRALHRCAVLGLEARHSCGVHVIIPPLHTALYEVYLSSGFTDVSVLWKRKDGCKVFGKRLSNAE